MSRVVTRIEKQVRHAVPAKMLGLGNLVGEHDALRINAALARLAAYVALEFGSQLQQPENAAGHLLENAHPQVEDERFDLIVVIETTIDETLLRQPEVAALHGGIVDGLLA